MKWFKHPTAQALIREAIMEGPCIKTPTATPGVFDLAVSPKIQQIRDLRAFLTREVLARRSRTRQLRRQARGIV